MDNPLSGPYTKNLKCQLLILCHGAKYVKDVIYTCNAIYGVNNQRDINFTSNLCMTKMEIKLCLLLFFNGQHFALRALKEESFQKIFVQNSSFK